MRTPVLLGPRQAPSQDETKTLAAMRTVVLIAASALSGNRNRVSAQLFGPSTAGRTRPRPFAKPAGVFRPGIQGFGRLRGLGALGDRAGPKAPRKACS